MLLDRENLLSYKQQITTSTTSMDKIYLGPSGWAGNANGGDYVPIICAAEEAFTAAGAATLTIQLRSSAAADMSNPRLHQSVTLSLADLAPGARPQLGLNMPEDALSFLDAVYTVGTGPFTAGRLTLGVAWSRQSNRF